MRIVDELDTSTAALFERVCQHRLGNTLIGCLVGELNFMEQKRLVTAGLVVEPGFAGQVRKANEMPLNTGGVVNLIPLEVAALAFPVSVQIASSSGQIIRKPLTIHEKRPAIPVYVLTDEGHAISSILGHDEEACFIRYRDRLLAERPRVEIMELRDGPAGGMIVVNHWNKPAVQPPTG